MIETREQKTKPLCYECGQYASYKVVPPDNRKNPYLCPCCARDYIRKGFIVEELENKQ